jgi:hypothetical protein
VLLDVFGILDVVFIDPHLAPVGVHNGQRCSLLIRTTLFKT